MYSSRRRYYRKNYRRNLFCPSYRTGIPPTYNQMKGRVIRTTPLYDNPNQLPPVMSKAMLEQMKKILIDAKYIPTPQALSKYTAMLTYQLRLSSIPLDGYNLDANALITICNTRFSLPPPATDTHWNYSLMGFNFIRNVNSSTDGSRFAVNWGSPLLEHTPYALVTKSVDLAGYNGYYSLSVFVTAGDQPYTAHAVTVTFGQYSITGETIPISTNDQSPQDNETYPLVTTDSSIETHDSTLYFTKGNTDYQNIYAYNLYLLCYLSPD